MARPRSERGLYVHRRTLERGDVVRHLSIAVCHAHADTPEDDGVALMHIAQALLGIAKLDENERARAFAEALIRESAA